MAERQSSLTFVDARAKLYSIVGAPMADPTEYWSLVSALKYLKLTHSNLANVVQQVCLFMHDPRELHISLLKRIRCYVKGMLSTGLGSVLLIVSERPERQPDGGQWEPNKFLSHNANKLGMCPKMTPKTCTRCILNKSTRSGSKRINGNSRNNTSEEHHKKNSKYPMRAPDYPVVNHR